MIDKAAAAETRDGGQKRKDGEERYEVDNIFFTSVLGSIATQSTLLLLKLECNLDNDDNDAKHPPHRF